MKISRTSIRQDGEGRSPSPSRRRDRPFAAVVMLLAGIVLGGAAVWMATGDGDDRVPTEAPPSFDILDAAPAPAAPIAGSAGAPAERSPYGASNQSPTAPSTPYVETNQADESIATGSIEHRGSSATGAPTEAPHTAAPPRVDITSGLLENYQPQETLRPVRLVIPSLKIDAAVDPVGYDRRKDEMEIPRSASVAGWYEYGPSPGEAGSSVISAHVDWGGNKGVFFGLRNIEPNAVIVVEYEDGSQRKFTAVTRDQYDKDELPVEEIFSRAGRPILTLITCGGAFNPSIDSYQDNVVVQAVEIIEREPNLALRSGM